MEKQKLTFENLPEAVFQLNEKLEKIEKLLQARNTENPKPEPDSPLNIDEAAAFLRLAKSTLYSKVSRRELPCKKQGNRLYFFKSELTEYLKEGKQKTLDEIHTEAENYINDFQSKAA